MQQFEESESLTLWNESLDWALHKNDYYTTFKLPKNNSIFSFGAINNSGSDLRLYSTVLSGCYIKFANSNGIHVILMNNEKVEFDWNV